METNIKHTKVGKKNIYYTMEPDGVFAQKDGVMLTLVSRKGKPKSIAIPIVVWNHIQYSNIANDIELTPYELRLMDGNYTNILRCKKVKYVTKMVAEDIDLIKVMLILGDSKDG